MSGLIIGFFGVGLFNLGKLLLPRLSDKARTPEGGEGELPTPGNSVKNVSFI